MNDPQFTFAASVENPPELSPVAQSSPPATPPPAPVRHHVVYPTVLDSGRSLLSIIVIALFVLTFIVQPFRIPSESMEHTLLVGDFLLVNKMIYSPSGIWRWLLPYRQIQRGDIVVFHFPLDPTDHVVKRKSSRFPVIVCTFMTDRSTSTASNPPEPYAVYGLLLRQLPRPVSTNLTDPGVDTRWWMEMRHDVQHGDLIVPQDHYFVLGDNRNHSRDSRYWGFVPRANIVGRPFLIYFSIRKPSTTDMYPTPLPGDRLGHDKDPVNSVVDFARWDRMFRIVW